MTEMNKLITNKNSKILIPALNYDIEKDARLLIPFTSFEKIGFVNHDGNVVVNPKYIMYYGECYNNSDLIKVAIDDIYSYPRENGSVATYHRPLYGVINAKGEVILDTIYFSLVPAIEGQMFTVQNKKYQYGVLGTDGTEIIPFGKYNWIDGFDKGLARVRVGSQSSDNKWGIINEQGHEVLPVIYDDVWNFYGKDRSSTKVKDHDIYRNILFTELLNVDEELEDDYMYDNYDEGLHFGKYVGSYAQDVMGYSDEAIDDAFEGDPDAYWNID